MLFTQQANVGALLETESLKAVGVIGQGGKRYPPLDRETVKTIFPFLAVNDACVGVGEKQAKSSPSFDSFANCILLDARTCTFSLNS